MSTTEKISTTEDVSTTEKISTTEDVSTTEKITTTEETINTTTTVPTEISSTIGFDKGTTASALESAKDENITSGDDVVHTTTHNNVEKSEIPNTGESKTSIIAFAILLTIAISVQILALIICRFCYNWMNPGEKAVYLEVKAKIVIPTRTTATSTPEITA